MAFKIPQQTEAERDEYLIDCFHDAGFIRQLVEKRYSILSGRKGSGKTALARYLETKYSEHSIDFAFRISIRSLSLNSGEKREDRLNTLLFFVIIKTIQKLLSVDIFSDESRKYWLDFLEQNGLQTIQDYESFVERRRKETTGFSLKGILGFFGVGSAETKFTDQAQAEYGKAQISNTPHSLLTALISSLPSERKMFVFLDDISDYLDETKDDQLVEDVALIKSLLLALDTFNGNVIDAQKSFQFVSLIRNDLFDYMDGSNINKLVSNALELEWNERSFACLLIRRLPFYEDNLDESLRNPVEAIREWFPDDIFAEALSDFDTGRHGTNFYAYMAAISFNRPRDFLKFCYAMRNRLSGKHPAELENIESAEIEYTDYLTVELRDELFLASRFLHFEADTESLNRLIDILSQKNGFGIGQLRSDLTQHFGNRTKIGRKKADLFIGELWRYGVVGFKRKEDHVIQFKYLGGVPFIVERIKEYTLYLHRGLWWFAQKRRERRSGQ